MMLQLVLLAALLPGAADQTLPRFTLPPQYVERDPLWVSVDEAFSPEGDLREGIFSSGARDTMPRQVVVSAAPGEPRKPGPDCLGGIANMRLPLSGPDRSLLDLTRSASRMRISVSVSTLDVASSSTRMRGSKASARANDSNCFCPTESVEPRSATGDAYPAGRREMNESA